jgi:serine protease AprX
MKANKSAESAARRRRARIGRILGPLAFAVLAIVSTPSQQLPLSAWLDTALRQARPDDRHVIWIYFRDKGRVTTGGVEASSALSARARARRAARARPLRETAVEDLPLERTYVAIVTRQVARVRHESRWLNAVSAEATAAQVRAIAGLPFVTRVDLVKRYRRLREEPIEPLEPQRRGVSAAPRATHLDYGTSFMQVAQIGVPDLHDRGLTGAGVVVAVFDTGFPNLSHKAFTRLNVAGEHNFITGTDTVRNSTDNHGTATLSVLGGMHEGHLIGPAFGATFLLAVTEDVRSETPVEEDNWAVAAEWAERMGADIISSSLGYLSFDLPFTSYTDRDMDGQTAVTTRAAAMAAARGVVVVNSAGNGGFRSNSNTLGAPSDGRQVIAAGAVDGAGNRAAFSSVGPTADGRIKPDVAALGVSVKVASPAISDSYAMANGTSFSCPLTAGAVALLLQAHPTYTVEQVLSALRSTASQGNAPDNLLGWGIVNAAAAVDADLRILPTIATSMSETRSIAPRMDPRVLLRLSKIPLIRQSTR